MPKVKVTKSKGLVQSSGRGFHLSAAFVLGRQSKTAGTTQTQAGATEIDANFPLVLVTNGNSSDGIKLPPLSEVDIGTMYWIYNTHASNTLELYPNSNDKLGASADDAPHTIAGDAFAICVAIDGTRWAVTEPAATGA